MAATLLAGLGATTTNTSTLRYRRGESSTAQMRPPALHLAGGPSIDAAPGAVGQEELHLIGPGDSHARAHVSSDRIERTTSARSDKYQQAPTTSSKQRDRTTGPGDQDSRQGSTTTVQQIRGYSLDPGYAGGEHDEDEDDDEEEEEDDDSDHHGVRRTGPSGSHNFRRRAGPSGNSYELRNGSGSRKYKESHSSSDADLDGAGANESVLNSSVRTLAGRTGTTFDELQDGAQYWVNKRHTNNGNPSEDVQQKLDWRLKPRLKTVAAALTLCLNLGVDPPDIVKTTPCAKLECWIDPSRHTPTKALESIGRNLQQQFETLSPKVRYKQYLDPSVEEAKKFCVNLRKQAKEDRVLMYYNGHGVPKPTASGEIWVFNKNYTQYIPVSLYDLQSWLGSPCVFVWDCSAAGNILTNYNRWAERRDNDHRTGGGGSTSTPALPDSRTSASGEASPAPGTPNGGTAPNSSAAHNPLGPTTYTPYMECIHLAACRADQVLPMTPDLPADLFTSCLTSPIEIALRFFVLQDPLRFNVDPADPKARVTVDMVNKIPGDLKERKTPLGELNWIFTAVTDTIAWLVFPRDTFKKLFRHDLLVAALFRNYLLAERIMRAYHCTPMSHPALPETHNHPLWASWDLAVDNCLNQLPALLDAEARAERDPQAPPLYTYQPSKFFTEHLKAFEIWLEHGGATASSAPDGASNSVERRQPPDQLPIVLQVLLSQAHRLRALILLSRFVDLGPWAVHLALSIGIFPYVQKLLQSPAADLKPVLIFIWARILAIDRSCQADLLKDAGYNYFAKVLAPAAPVSGGALMIPNASEHRGMCAFILSVVSRGFRQGQVACLNSDVLRACFLRLHEQDWYIKQWAALCIAQIWADGHDEAKQIAIKEGYQDQLLFMLKDDSAEVRASAMYAIGTLLGATGMPAGSGPNKSEPKGGGGTGVQVTISERDQLELEAGIAQACVLQSKEDASPLVRKELVVVLSCVAREWRGWFVAAAWTYHEQQEQTLWSGSKGDSGRDSGFVEGSDVVGRAMREWRDYATAADRPPEEHEKNRTILFVFRLMYMVLLDLSVDPHPEVASLACTVVDYLTALLLDSAFNRAKGSTLKVREYEERTKRRHVPIPDPAATLTPTAPVKGLPPTSEVLPALKRSETGLSTASRLSGTLKRNSSIATALKSLATLTGYSTPDGAGQQSPTEDSAPKLSRQSTASQLHVQPYVSPYPMARSDTGISVASSTTAVENKPRRNPSLGNLLQSQIRNELGFTGMNGESDKPRASVAASSVIQALTEEDMERLRIRRNSKTEAGGGANGLSANAGMPQSHELGLGMVAKDVKDDVLPLRSEFYDFSLEYHRDPQMKDREENEPGSIPYNEMTWRQQRNHRMIERTRREDYPASRSNWNRSLGSLSSETWPARLLFHSYEPHLVVSDEQSNICVWDWKARQRLARFENGAAAGSTVSSMHFINENTASLLLTASTDGSIRLFRDYDMPERTLTSAFGGLAERFPVSRKAGIVTAWEQFNGHLLVGGDSRLIRCWDADREALIMDIPTQAGSNVTALALDMDTEMFIAGFGDGVLRVFDKRIGREQSMVRVLRQHHTWIQSVHMQKGGEHSLVSGSMNGDVKIWDIRASDVPLTSSNVAPNGLSALAVHDHAPIFATTAAPCASSQASHSLAGNSHPSGSRRGQKLGVYRIERNSGTHQERSIRGRERLAGGSNNSSAFQLREDGNGPQPTCLTSTVLRGDAGSVIGSGHGMNPVDGFSDPTRQGGPKARYGASMNALVFHPNELVLAVGGFDQNHGSVKLLSYDPGKNGGVGTSERQWE